MADYEKVAVEALPDAPNPTRHKKEVDEAVGATEFGFNVYQATPGQRIPWGYLSTARESRRSRRA
jgi:hypothetical protein